MCGVADIGNIFSSAGGLLHMSFQRISFAWLHATFCFISSAKCAIAMGVRAELCGPRLMALVICDFVHGFPVIVRHPGLDHLLRCAAARWSRARPEGHMLFW
jgi:hypothetical protein